MRISTVARVALATLGFLVVFVVAGGPVAGATTVAGEPFEYPQAAPGGIASDAAAIVMSAAVLLGAALYGVFAVRRPAAGHAAEVRTLPTDRRREEMRKAA